MRSHTWFEKTSGVRWTRYRDVERNLFWQLCFELRKCRNLMRFCYLLLQATSNYTVCNIHTRTFGINCNTTLSRLLQKINCASSAPMNTLPCHHFLNTTICILVPDHQNVQWYVHFNNCIFKFYWSFSLHIIVYVHCATHRTKQLNITAD